jgi:hypothetical protein
MRYYAYYHTSGEGHVYQGRFKSFPIQDDEHFFAVHRAERGAAIFDVDCRAISGGSQKDVAAARLMWRAHEVRGLAPTAKRCRRYAAERGMTRSVAVPVLPAPASFGRKAAEN